jgi:hypothetical protein
MAATRYTVLLDEKAVRSLERLQQTYGLKNKAEVCRLAVCILNWVTQQEADACAFGRQKDGSFQQLLLPIEPDITKWNKEN